MFHFLRNTAHDFKIWRYLKKFPSTGQNFDILIQANTLLCDLIPIKIDDNRLVTVNITTYGPCMNHYLNHLKTLTNSMSKIEEIYVWRDGSLRPTTMWNWYQKNHILGDNNDPNYPFTAIQTQLQLFTDLVNADTKRWMTEGNNRQLHYIAHDTLVMVQLLQQGKIPT